MEATRGVGVIHIDFETRSKCVIQKTGAYRYSIDPSTDVMCMAFAIDDGPVEIWIPGEGFPFSSKSFGEHTFGGQWSFFERCIWENVMVPKYDWPPMPESKWRDTAATACYHALPRALDQVGMALDLEHKKDLAGKRVMMKLSRPSTKFKDDPCELWNNAASDFRELYQYCKDDVAAERDIHRALRPLPEKELAVWQLDQKINWRGIRVDRKAVIAALRLLEGYSERLKGEFKALTGLESPTLVGQFKTWLAARGCIVESLDKNAVVSVLEAKTRPFKSEVYRALQIRQALGKTSTAKYQAIMECIGPDDKVRGLLTYHGASTGRWTGQLVQPQNLPRNNFKGNLDRYFEVLKSADLDTFELCYPVMQTISSTVRGVFIPSEGHTFFGGDYSAIEARVLFWLASESRGLQMFRAGEDIYRDMATAIYDVPLASVTKDQRELGKRGVLGCGYGMGAKKFKETCMTHARVNISADLAERAVQAYRTKYRTVAVLWQLQELAAKEAIETKKPVKCGKVTWFIYDRFLMCHLPSGRNLSYPDPKIEMVETFWGEKRPGITFMGLNSTTKAWERTGTYGGKIVENITQAVARDIMAEAMLRVEAARFRVVLTVHDELLTETDRIFADVRLGIQTFETLMATPPAWAAGLPIAAEGWTGRRYSK